jgi:methylthioribose-1-phosphate isomerase
LITDGMSGSLMQAGKVDMVVVGADRIVANGDTANKIGTYNLALVAHAHKIPFYVAAPTSTLDLSLATGQEIPIEERAADEIYWIHDEAICPQDTKFYNPSFDVTPARYIAGIITEKGIARPPYAEVLKKLFIS